MLSTPTWHTMNHLTCKSLRKSPSSRCTLTVLPNPGNFGTWYRSFETLHCRAIQTHHLRSNVLTSCKSMKMMKMLTMSIWSMAMTLFHHTKPGFQTTLCANLCHELSSSHRGLLHETSSGNPGACFVQFARTKGYEKSSVVLCVRRLHTLAAKDELEAHWSYRVWIHLDLRKYGTVPHGDLVSVSERMVTFAGTNTSWSHSFPTYVAS